ncbi:MAG: protein translocase subunit SecD [Planctomycetes bacterium]|nr:protein translocase subunit SecD [Planctomycetota bacterium]
MPKFWTRLVDSLPRESKNLTWRAPLVAVVLVLAFLIFLPFQDTPYAVRVAVDTYDDRGRVKEEEREVESFQVTNRWVWLTSPFHYEVERELTAEPAEPKDGRPRKRRTLLVLSRGLNLGLDLRGGTELLYRILHDAEAVRSVSAEEIKAVVQRRIDAYGLREVRIQAQGADRLLVQLPGQEAAILETLKSVIQNIGHLEFRLVAPENSEPSKTWKETGKAPPGWTEYSVRSLKEEKFEERKILVRDQVEMTGENISAAWVDTTGSGRRLGPSVSLRFTSRGEREFARITGEHINEQLAIILNTVRDGSGNIARDEKGELQLGTCYSAPTIQTRIFGNAVIEGDFTIKECEALTTVLRAGSLPAPLRLEHETSVGASLGSALINKGVLAAAIGAVAVILFMACYYLLAGFIADMAVVLNLLMLVAIMILFDATLTLPGIAGLALTVGMAVDANVLIFERIREEMAGSAEKPLRLAVREGFDRAFWTIFDSNLTTILTAAILYWIGTGPVKGFGLTLMIGLLLNMFTAIVMGRVVFDILTWRRWVTRLPMLQFFKQPNFRFMGMRYKAFIVSGLVIAIGMAAFITRGERNWDIDFRGGTMLHAVFRHEMDAEEITRRLKAIGPEFAQAEVQSLAPAAQAGTSIVPGRRSTEFEIRVPSLSEVAIPTITPTLTTSPGAVEAAFTLAAPATLGEVREKTKATSLTIELSGPPDADGKQTAFKLTAAAIDAKQVRADLEKALGTPLAAFQVAKLTVNYANEAPVECDRAISLVELERRLRATDPHIKVEPQGAEEEAGKGAYRKFLIKTTLAEASKARLAIERAFAALSFKAEIMEAFKDDLAPQGIEPLAEKEGRTTLALNLTKAIEPAVLTARLAAWAIEATAKPLPEGTAGPAEKFELALASDKVPELTRRVTEDAQTFLLSDPIPRVAKVGPAVAHELLAWAIVGVAASCVAIIAYVWLRFERIKYGAAGVAALVHDVLVTMGMLALLDRKFNITIIAGLLTIVGYSINDTIVIFDRIRENLRKERRRDVDSDLVDRSVNQTLSRTIITTFSTLLAVLALFFFAGGVIQDFALTMLIGMIAGTYSTVFIASPILIIHQEQIEKRLARAKAAAATS